MSQRAVVLEQMLAKHPGDARLLFGLAVEYLNGGDLERGAEALSSYLALTDDEGNAWGRLGHALQELGRTAEARDAFREGIRSANRHGHPTLAEELTAALEEVS